MMKTMTKMGFIGLIILFNSQFSYGQSIFSKLFENAIVEYSYNPGFDMGFNWRIDQPLTEPLKYLTPKDDAIGLLKDTYSADRPMPVRFHHTDYSEGPYFPSYNTYELMAKLLINVPKDPRLFIGLTMNYGESYFEARTYDYLSDVPFGRLGTSYFVEANTYDSILVEFRDSRPDSLFVFPRSKAVFVEKPQFNYGLGVQMRYILSDDEHLSRDNRFRLSAELGMSLSSSLKSPTTVYWSYFDYYQYGDVEFVGVYDDWQYISWKNRVSTKVNNFNFIAPAITDIQLYYGLNLAIKPFLKAPIRLGLRWNTTHHNYFRQGKLLATNMVFSGGFILQIELGQHLHQDTKN